MLKVRMNCPICGNSIGARSLEPHLEIVHELTGTVTIRLNPTHPYSHEPEPAEVATVSPAEPETTSEPEPEPQPEHEPEPEPSAEAAPEESRDIVQPDAY